MSARWLAAGAAAVFAAAGLVAAAGWRVFLRDVAEPAGVAEAIAAFRERGAAGDGARSSVPAGVYVYDTEGFEGTDALGGATHRYPAVSTLSITPEPCGVRMRWDVLEGRFTTWALCVGREGWVHRSREERHTFFGIADDATYACRGTALRPAGDRPGTTFAVSCATDSATERGRGRVVGREVLDVGGADVASVHVRTATWFGGETTGNATFDFWLARDTGLPVRITMVSTTTNRTLIGDVHYEEDVSLALRSLTPRR